MPDPPSDPPAAWASSSQAICVYAEPLVAGRRVVVVGDASTGVGERLLELGARTVHLYDPEVPRGTAEAGSPARGLVVRGLPSGAFDVRDGAFDVAIVLDLGACPGQADLLLRIRRLLAKGGVSLIGASAAHVAGPPGTPEPLGYYELYDLVALQFSHVRMIAQVPFAGVALADLGLEGTAPEVSVDTQLAGDAEAPEHFFALASQEEVRLSEYAIIQLPSPPLRSGPPGSGPFEAEAHGVPPRVEEDSAARAALAQAQLRATLLEAQIDELKARAGRQGEVLELAERAAELEARLAAEGARVRDAEARAAEHFSRAERFSHEAREIGVELSRERDRATALGGALVGAEAAVDALRQRAVEGDELLARRESELREVLVELERLRSAVVGAGQEELARLGAMEARAAALDAEVARAAEENAAELGELEQALRARAQLVLELEQEVTRRERIVRELLGSLDEARNEIRDAAPQDALGEPPVDGSLAIARDLELKQLELATSRRELEAREASVRAEGERAGALAAANEELRARLDSLAMDLARREGERQDVAWRVAELEQQISWLEAEQTELTLTLPPPPMGVWPARESPAGAEASRIADLEGEIDVLRQAMAQEHEARVHAESGDELAKARAELARQAVLLEQLSRELDARDRARLAESPGQGGGRAAGEA